MSWVIRIDLGLLPWRSAAPTAEATPVLPRLAYLTLCRSIRLLAQLARGRSARLTGAVPSWRGTGSSRQPSSSTTGSPTSPGQARRQSATVERDVLIAQRRWPADIWGAIQLGAEVPSSRAGSRRPI